MVVLDMIHLVVRLDNLLEVRFNFHKEKQDQSVELLQLLQFLSWFFIFSG